MFIDLDDKAIEVKRDKEVEELITMAAQKLTDITLRAMLFQLIERAPESFRRDVLGINKDED